MKARILLALVLLISGVARAQKSSVLEVKALHDKYCKAVETKDSVFLKQLFHDDMIMTGGTGVRRNKAQEIKDALDPKYAVTYFRSLNEQILDFDLTVIVLGDLNWEFVLEGKTSQLERRFTFTYTKVKGNWKIVSQHIGRVPPPEQK